MSRATSRMLSRLMLVGGLALLLYGGVTWWQQAAFRYTVGAEHVVLAVTRVPQRDAAPLATVTLPPVNDGEGDGAAAPESDALPTATVALTPRPPEPPTRIIAPTIALDAPIVEMGWETREDDSGEWFSEWVVPAFAAGWHKNSALPGNGGNTVVSAHHNVDGEVFRYLVDLEPGDRVELDTVGQAFSYVVEEKYIVAEQNQPPGIQAENAKFIQETADERLTLVSCWPYESNSHRVIVIARPVGALSPATGNGVQ